jgi:transmembrane sensor
MSYNHFTAEDFFHDSNFRKWVLQPDPELNIFWEKWLLNHPNKKEDVALARKMIKAVQIDEYEWSDIRKKSLWQRILLSNQVHKRSIDEETKIINISYQKPASRTFFRFTWLRVAVISVLILVSLYFLNLQSESTIEEPRIATVEKHNPNGQKSKIFLPDGSVAYLNSNSRLTYPLNFDNDTRHVKLSGEAFFEVASDSLRPFLVESNQLFTRVLGTSFSVYDFPGQEDVSVSLVEGTLKVISKDNQQEVLLQPGESAMLNMVDNQLSTVELDYLTSVAWKDGILYFKETALDHAFSTLEQWYGVRFTFSKPPIANVKVTGKFENEYLANVLRSLSYSVSFSYEIKNGTDVQIKFE